MNNPLDVSQSIPSLPDQWQDLPGDRLGVQGIPGLISADAITASYLALMADQVKRENDLALGVYGHMIQVWHDNNARGIFQPAPGPVKLALFNPKVGTTYLTDGKNGAQVITYALYWDPAVPPGTIASPPPPVTSSGPHTVGAKVAGTDNIYRAEGGTYTDPDIGTETTGADGGKYVLVGFMGTHVWKRE